MGKCLSCCFHESQSSQQPLIQPFDASTSTCTLSSSSLGPSDFIIEKLLGKGTFGKVFLVCKKDTGAPYAMKVLKKTSIAKRNQRMHTATEREILGSLRSPFLVQLHFAFQTDEKLYMVMDYVPGGELFYHLKHSGRFTESRTRFYAAEILVALETLHVNGFIYRDLKPENILLTAEGHIKLSDFGLSKKGLDANFKAYTFCGTPEYLAPEILKGEGHDSAVDFWSFGALVYEMMTGFPPFYSKNRAEMYEAILSRPPDLKSYFSPELSDLLLHLLEVNPKHRLASHKEVRRHPFFGDIDWTRLVHGEVKPPFCPRVCGAKDTTNFDRVFTDEKAAESPAESLASETKAANRYQGFTYSEQL